MKRIAVLGCVLMTVLAGCSEQVNPRVATRLNTDAVLMGALPANPLANRVITSWIDRQNRTMSTMFGNDVAVKYARANSDGQYPASADIEVVTWGQQEDPRWFGGSIPHGVKTVEFVTVTGPGVFTYERHEGSPLKQVASVAGNDPKDRAAYLLAQRAAVMP